MSTTSDSTANLQCYQRVSSRIGAQASGPGKHRAQWMDNPSRLNLDWSGLSRTAGVQLSPLSAVLSLAAAGSTTLMTSRGERRMDPGAILRCPRVLVLLLTRRSPLLPHSRLWHGSIAPPVYKWSLPGPSINKGKGDGLPPLCLLLTPWTLPWRAPRWTVLDRSLPG
ncbi:uncharacterized protein BJX67DRAFT_296702 [Aspergillus lucknowensis]|uniref:Uncharacterized protein n=1 Tax=Aspergillus lucknowensis TaxID=176173 RepID=A0ABR4LD63_9EURO